MIKRYFLLMILLIFLFPTIFALCEEGQIDINSASLEKLEEIIHVGPAVAGYIVEARPFSSIDELVNVSYISEGYLEDIKSQGLACVNRQSQEEDDDETPPINDTSIENDYDDEDEETNETVTGTDNITDNYYKALNENKREPITAEIIKLNPKVIKSEDDGENDKDLSDYAIYGFVVFCILLGFLFALKKYKAKKNETEW